MKINFVIHRIGAVLLIMAMFFLSGCDILEYLFEDDSNSYDQGPSQANTPQLIERPSPIGYRVTLSISELSIYNGEEDDWPTSTGDDEIVLQYYMIENNPGKDQLKRGFQIWGWYTVHAGETYGRNAFDTISIDIPLNSGVVTGVQLVEIDDFDYEQDLMHLAKEYDLLGFAAAFNVPVEWKGIDLTSKNARWVIYNIGIPLADTSADVYEFFDSNDLLGQEQAFATSNQLAQTASGQASPLWIQWVFEDTHNTDFYSYVVGQNIDVSYIYP